MRYFLFLLFLASACLACKSTKNGTQNMENLVFIKTSGCFGFCPVFQLTIQANGLSHYEGKQFVEKMGKDSFQLTREELAELKAKIKAVNLWQYPDHIKTDVADAPHATITVYEKQKSKTVSGSIDRPKPILELEELLKDLATKHGCPVKHGIDPKQIPASTRKEMIVQLKEDLNAGNWIRQYYDLRIQLVRRVGEKNLWLVAYDSAQMKEADMLEMVKNADGVIAVTPNEKVQDRKN